MRQDLAEIDENCNGKISVEELKEGFDSNAALRERMRSLDMKKSDLKDFFDLLDSHNNGELEYDNLIDAIVSTTEGDHRKHMMMVRLQTAEIGRILNKSRLEMEQIRTSIISENGLILNENRFAREEKFEFHKSKSEPHKQSDQNSSLKEMRSGKPSVEAMFQYSTQGKFPVVTGLQEKIKNLERDVLQAIDDWALTLTFADAHRCADEGALLVVNKKRSGTLLSL
mmetsp:Transcript_129165/g.228517  ORF Transcript_129165/g.228517 Transcript_129165/m.228517 type:complete len:226 (+) Transcript_129165:1-678(+)